ncbi:MAG TPA: hypothetical protein VMT63_14760 [Bacteroidales bacterium]|nr:hypothetical protein [Bacteroidales bacterium]
MNTGEIYRLLGKYYDGLSSEEEERELRRLFREGTVPPELEPDSRIFSYMDQDEAGIPMPDEGFEARVIEAINRSGEKGMPVIRRKLLYSILSSAAAVALITAFWFLFINRSEPSDTFKDPRLAYNEAARILYSVSEKMNTGLNAMEPARKASKTASAGIGMFEKSAGMINDNLRPLNYFRKAMVIVSSPLESKKTLK